MDHIHMRNEVNIMYDVTALGELLIDFTGISTDTHGYPTVAAHPGGAPPNFLAALAKFGAKTALISKVGDDAFGKLLINTMAQAGIETKAIAIDSNVFTTLAFVTLDPSGDRSFSFARKPGADTSINADTMDLSMIDNAKIFHFGTLSLTHEPARTATVKAVAYAKEKGKLITLDPNLRKPLWDDPDECKKQLLWAISQADVIKISDDEVEYLFGLEPEAGAEHILKTYGTKLVFVTCGPKGCYFKNPVASGFVNAPTGIKAVDTTGAGDIFGGSAVWKLLQTGKSPEALNGEELTDIAAFACTAASLSTTKPGGVTSVPELQDVLSLMQK